MKRLFLSVLEVCSILGTEHLKLFLETFSVFKKN